MPQRAGRAIAFTLLLMAAAVPAMAQSPTNAPAPAAQPAAPPTQAPQATPAGPVYSITFFEVAIPTAGKAARMLHQFAVTTRKEAGNTGVLALREIGRPERFAVIEAWRDKPALEAHAATMTGLREQLQPLFTVPFDTRSNYGLAVAGPPLGAEAGASHAVYVLTHVDVFPAGKDQTIELLKQLTDSSRKEIGNLRFDVLQQEGRANHLPLIEAWRDQHALADHPVSQHTRAFRAKLVPLQGALYDERLYRAL